ncbi:tetratricopeptide repeat protein [Micromonospora chalcea]|uniref:tetratricopeptide repeat protein n=1 Tax=Micromonospora chalcea TaxID=1874 RepID=UPI00331E7A09
MAELTIGRAGVRTEFDRLWAAPDGPRLFVLWGEPGIGKSHLLGRFAEQVGTGKSATVDLDSLDVGGTYTDPVGALLRAIAGVCAPWAPEAAGEFDRIAEAAAEAETRLLTDRPEINVSLKAGLGATISDSPITVEAPPPGPSLAAIRQSFHPRLLRALVTLVERSSPGDKLLMLDTFERTRQLSDEDAGGPDDATRHRPNRPNWVERVLLPALTGAGLRLAVAGWNDVTTPVRTHRWRLIEWTAPDTRAYLSSRGVADPALQSAVHVACGGHPAWTAMVADAWDAGVAGGRPLTVAEIRDAARHEPVDRWLVPMFLDRLASRLRPIVVAAAIPRQFTVDAVRALFDDAQRETVLYDGWARDLFSFSFVRRIAGAGARDTLRRLHPLVRTAVLQSERETDPDRTRLLHGRAASHCQRHGQVHDEHYHRFAAGDMTSAERWLAEVRAGERLGLVGNTRLLIEVATPPECVEQLEGGAADVLFEAYYAVSRVYPKDVDRCRLAAERGYALALQLNVPLEAANFVSKLAMLRLRDGDLDGAEASLRAALSVYEQLDNAVGRCNVMRDLGWVFEERGRLDLARGLYASSGRLALDHGYRDNAVYALLNLAKVAENDDRRRELVLHAAQVAEQGASLAAVLRVRAALAELAAKDGDEEGEREHLLVALGEAGSIIDVEMEIVLGFRLALSYMKANKWPQAQQSARFTADRAMAENDTVMLIAAREIEAKAVMHTDLPAAEPLVDCILAAASHRDGPASVKAALLQFMLAGFQEEAGDLQRAQVNLVMAGSRVANAPVDQRGGEAARIDALGRSVQKLGHRFKEAGIIKPLGLIGHILLRLYEHTSDTAAIAHGWLFTGLGKTQETDISGKGEPADNAAAEKALETCLRLFGPDGDIGCRATAHGVLGQLRLAAGRVPEAREDFLTARQLWTDQGWQDGIRLMDDLLGRLDAAG